MPLHLTWQEIAIRLALVLIASGALGFDRGRGGHVAGLRTTILVGLAACVAMLQANALLPTAGKTGGAFSTLDLMRLPLGILTGVGFIGAGTIFRRGDLVTGVTTAATLWVTTVIGLCIGGGQLGLGVAGTVIAFITIDAVKIIEMRLPREHQANVVLEMEFADAQDLEKLLAPWGCKLRVRRFVRLADCNLLTTDLLWRQREIDARPIELIGKIEERFRVLSINFSSPAK